MASDTARDWGTILGCAFPSTAAAPPPHPQHGRPPLGGNVAASPRHVHWEAVERILSAPFLAHPTRGGQQPTEGLSKHDGRMAVDQCATSGRASQIIERGHIAATPTLGPHHLISKHHSSHRDHAQAARPSPRWDLGDLVNEDPNISAKSYVIVLVVR